MQTILRSVLSNRADAQSTTPSSSQAMLATHTGGADSFSKVFDDGLAEPIQTHVMVPQEQTAKTKSSDKAEPTERKADTESEPETAKVASSDDRIDINTSQMRVHSHPGQESVPTKPDADVDRQSIAPQAQSENRSAEPVFGFGNQPGPTREQDRTVDVGAPKQVNIRHLSVAAALVNGVAHQSEMTPRFERSAFEPNGKTPHTPSGAAEGVTLTEAHLQSRKNAGSGMPMPAQAMGVHRAQTDQGVTPKTAMTRAPEHAVHLGSHMIPETTRGLERPRFDAPAAPKAAQAHLAPPPPTQPSVMDPRQSKPLSRELGQSEPAGQKTDASRPVLATDIVNAQTNLRANSQQTIQHGRLTETPANALERSERAAAPKPFLPNTSQDQPAQPATRTEPQTGVPARVAMGAPSTFSTEMHPRGRDRNAVAAPTIQSPEVQSPTTLLPTAKPVIGPTITKVMFDPSTTLSHESVEEFQWDLRPQTAPSGSTQNTLMPHRHEMPGHIAQQLAQAMHRNPDRPVEIALNPAELGRVRMTLTASETGIVVSILADRPETLDLMRRNINDLSNTFSDLGYEDIAFAFGQNENPSDASGDEQSGKTEILSLDLGEHDDDTARPVEIPRLAVSADGIDLRL